MLRLFFLALIVLVKAEDLLGVNYSFNVDFYSNFNNHGCGKESNWRLVSYGSLDVIPLSINRDKAIQALGESCTSSFPIIFIGGTVEINVYSQVVSNSLYLRIGVFDEDGTPVTSVKYRRGSKVFGRGWQTISLKVDKYFKGYINLRGKSLKNDTLLIDSFQYTPNNTYIAHRAKRSVPEIDDEDEIIFNYKVSTAEHEYDSLESSGDGDNVDDKDPTEKPIVDDPQPGTIWNPFTISLVSFAVVVVIALFVVAAYHIGKVKGLEFASSPYVDVEPPRTLTIPRIPRRSSRIGHARL